MFLSHFILSQLLWFGSLFCRLEAYGSTLLWKLSFVGGMDPVTCQGLMLCGICVCAVAGRSISLLSEVQWIVYGLCFGVFVGLLWLHAPPLITFTVVFLLLENSCGFSCTECWLECWDGFPCRHGNSGLCVRPLRSWGREFNVDLKFWNRCLDLWVSVPRLQ